MGFYSFNTALLHSLNIQVLVVLTLHLLILQHTDHVVVLHGPPAYHVQTKEAACQPTWTLGITIRINIRTISDLTIPLSIIYIDIGGRQHSVN